MATTIAAYFSAELLDWIESATFYNNEIIELSQKLELVIRRNTIVGIAAQVEIQQAILNRISSKFYLLVRELNQQQAALKKDSVWVENTGIPAATEQRQTELRQKMKMAEREFVEAKFDCYQFLSSTLRK